MNFFTTQHLAFTFGLLGNIISFFVFLSPIPTYYNIYKRKSTEGFQSIPYVVALFSAMLLMYYAFLKTENGTLLITINSFGCFVESIYIGLYIFYAPKKAPTVKLLMGMLGSYGMILLLTETLVHDHLVRLKIVGWICLIFSVCVFAAPLLILKQVIITKSVEYMPFALSLTLTFNAVMWFFYGFLIRDPNIALPNILGFGFGILQMLLYWWYKDSNKDKLPKDSTKVEAQVIIALGEKNDYKSPELSHQVIDIAKIKVDPSPWKTTTPIDGNMRPNMDVPVQA
ncbi:bidirectional sugar transporter SWEET9-like [Impatiens glandulifera]|uniref:bidirectional sugar transporter SWEET9-like n=1 Tax=Impatiens glandulifera TaxID=253017 RepID=UPI001FB0A43C|nr:bidirectional sugar transporter SWEET9-like [Impatiens glandulifera]